MRTSKYSIFIITAISIILLSNLFNLACARKLSAADTVRPISKYFENLTNIGVTPPDLSSIEGTKGTILTWQVKDPTNGQVTEYSWVLAKNTDDLKKALVAFDSARAWNTENYIFLPVSLPALDVHKKVGLMVPQAIYDEDGMTRIKELVLKGEVPTGSLVDQFEKFYE